MGDLIANFGIDFKLLIVQAINFLILLILLKKFAFGPIINILKKRREEIERGARFTKEAGEKLKTVEAIKEKKLEEARKEALSIVAASQDTARKRKEDILKETTKKSEAMIKGAKEAIEEEKAKMGEAVYQDAKNLIRLGIERILGKLPQRERDEILIDEALRQLKTEKQNTKL